MAFFRQRDVQIVVARVVFAFVVGLSISLMGWGRASECDLRSALSFLSLAPDHPHAPYHEKRAFDFHDPIMTEARSKWGRLKTTARAQGRFESFDLMHRSQLLTPVFQGAPAAKNLEMLRVLEDLNRQFASVKIFEKEFVNQFDRIPEEMDYVHFYVNRLKLYNDGIARFYKEVSKVDPALGKTLQEIPSISAFTPTEMKRLLLEEKKKGSGHLFDAFHDLVMESKAHVGELHASVSIPNVKKVNFHLQDIPDVEERLKAKLKDLGQHPEKLEAAKLKYPHIFNNKLVRDRKPATAEEWVKLVDRWLHDKEYDLLSDNMIVEVKRNVKPFDAQEFGKIKMRQKRGNDDVLVEVPRSGSLYDQAVEGKEVLEFLEMDRQLKFGYFTTNGMNDEVKKLLQDLGIQVIH